MGELRQPIVWLNTMIGDGGQSGFDVAIPEFRFHTFTGAAIDVNFDNGELSKWIWVGVCSARLLSFTCR